MKWMNPWMNDVMWWSITWKWWGRREIRHLWFMDTSITSSGGGEDNEWDYEEEEDREIHL